MQVYWSNRAEIFHTEYPLKLFKHHLSDHFKGHRKRKLSGFFYTKNDTIPTDSPLKFLHLSLGLQVEVDFVSGMFSAFCMGS